MRNTDELRRLLLLLSKDDGRIAIEESIDLMIGDAIACEIKSVTTQAAKRTAQRRTVEKAVRKAAIQFAKDPRVTGLHKKVFVLNNLNSSIKDTDALKFMNAFKERYSIDEGWLVTKDLQVIKSKKNK